MQVSVVIPTFNRRDLVIRTVQALLDQDFPAAEYQTIVVVDGSRDETAAALRALCTTRQLLIIEQENRGAAAARNTGWHAAESPLVIFVDDDMLCDRNLVHEHWAVHRDSDEIVGVGSVHPITDDPISLIAECSRIQVGTYTHTQKRPTGNALPFSAWTVTNTSVGRRWLMESCGFDERFRKREGAELIARLKKLGLKPRYVPQAEALRMTAKTLKELFNDAEVLAEDDALLIHQHPEVAPSTFAGTIAAAANQEVTRQIAGDSSGLDKAWLGPRYWLGAAFPGNKKLRAMAVRAVQTRRNLKYCRRFMALARESDGGVTAGAQFERRRGANHFELDEIREPAVAGQFYSNEPDQLRSDISAYTLPKNGPKLSAIGCLVPHAGYRYSGLVAGGVYERLELPRRLIILSPNHRREGAPMAARIAGAWRTPLGDARIDRDLAHAVLIRCRLLQVDSAAHRFEHAVELQLPFLQVLIPDFTFVPIAIGTGQMDALLMLGESIASAIEEIGEKALVIASSDMSHYESDSETRRKDRMAINRLLALDPEGLFEVVHQNQISMCGYGPAIAMLIAASRLGASRAELIKYATSGDLSGELDRVVGYAGLAVL
jgi:AmmeMemoRadiSam system protein B